MPECLPTILPSYKKPPVNEVYCGLRYRSLEKFKIPHLGLLWDKFREQYPKIEHALPVESTPGILYVDNATNLPLPRLWFINEQDNKLVQFQVDQFYFNWRQRGDDYPRYPQIIAGFETVIETIKRFFADHNLGELEPTGYELTYINHIPKGQGWKSAGDVGHVFKNFMWTNSGQFLGEPLNVAWNMVFQLPESKGTMVVKLNQATRKEDNTQILVLTLTVKGQPEQLSNDITLHDWYDIAHEWIVRGFTDLTTPEMNAIWEREDA